MTKEDEDTLQEKKTPELQQELEMAYSSSRVPPKADWWNRLARAIGRYFGLE
jgi:hypothetical protein